MAGCDKATYFLRPCANWVYASAQSFTASRLPAGCHGAAWIGVLVVVVIAVVGCGVCNLLILSCYSPNGSEQWFYVLFIPSLLWPSISLRNAQGVKPS